MKSSFELQIYERFLVFISVAFIYSFLAQSVQAKSIIDQFVDAGFDGNVTTLERLLDQGVDVNAQLEGGGPTALIGASAMGRKDAVNFLLNRQADINLQTVAGMTALMFASMQGHFDIVIILIKNGADLNLKEKGGYTALMMAENKGFRDVAQILRHPDVVKDKKQNGQHEQLTGKSNISKQAGLSRFVDKYPRTQNQTGNPPKNRADPASSTIAGAFGMNMGDNFDPTRAISSEELTNGRYMYQFNPTNKFRSIDQYFVLVTPITHKVYSIWGLSKYESGRNCHKDLDQIRKLLEEKYGKPRPQNLSEQMEGQQTTESGNRYIRTFCTRFMDISLQIQYYDKDLKKLSDLEYKQLDEKEFEQKSKDSSAL